MLVFKDGTIFGVHMEMGYVERLQEGVVIFAVRPARRPSDAF